MVVIRLSRGGSKKRPFYRVVVADKRFARDGRKVEQIGYFNPIAKGQETRLFVEMERLNYWVSVGAQMSDRVESLVKDYKKAAANSTAVEKAANA